MVELMVSIGVIAILAALVLPAVDAARGAARRMDCASKMRQIALACINHHDTYRWLPAGTYPVKSSTPHQGWLGRLLPFIEQQQMAMQSDAEFSNGAEFQVHTNFSKPIALFACAEDSRVYESQYAIRHSYRVGLTSYQGCNGTDFLEKDGVLYLGSKTRFRDVLDGVSHTFLFGERPPSPFFDLGWWYGGVGDRLSTGTLDHTLGVLERAKTKYAVCTREQSPRPGNSRDECDAEHYWSLHPGGLHFARVDGSVSFYSYSGVSIFMPLSTRNGAEVEPSE